MRWHGATGAAPLTHHLLGSEGVKDREAMTGRDNEKGTEKAAERKGQQEI